MPNQYLRRVGLLVGNNSTALDLSNLECDFQVKACDANCPTTAEITLYNPQPSTINSIQKEYQTVSLQAGYQDGNFGVIFSGSVLQVRSGKLDNVTRYLTLLCADGDLFHSFNFINTTLAPGATKASQLAAIQKTLPDSNVTLDPSANSALATTGGILPRGRVLFGLSKLYLNDLAASSNATWWIEGNTVKAAPLVGYLPGTAVEINSVTGMVGVPQSSEQGIIVRTLLNPLIRVGTAIKLNNNELTTTQVNQQGYPQYSNIALFANLDPTGLYRVLVAEHIGGIRKNPWYTDIVALAIDPSNNQVQAYG